MKDIIKILKEKYPNINTYVEGNKIKGKGKKEYYKNLYLIEEEEEEKYNIEIYIWEGEKEKGIKEYKTKGKENVLKILEENLYV